MSSSRSYQSVINTPPTQFSSFMDSSGGGGLVCSVASYTTLSSNEYNTGTVNNDPIYTHIPSLVKGIITYTYYNDGPLVIESNI